MVSRKKIKAILVLILIFSFVSVFAQTTENAALSKRNKFIENAKQFLGVPYVYGGTSKSGIDCSGLVFLAAKGIGLTLPRTASQMCEYSRIIEDSDRQAGDLLFFADNGVKVSHVAIYLGDNKMIHAASSGPKTGVIISELTESYWKRTYYCAGRILDAVTTTVAQNQSTTSTSSAASQQTNAQQTPTTTQQTQQPSTPQVQQTPQSAITQQTQPSQNKENDISSIPDDGIVIATVKKASKEQQQSSSSSSSKETSSNTSSQGKIENSFLKNITFDASVSGGWSLFNTEKFGLIFRGINAQGYASYDKINMKPGIGLAINIDPSMKIGQFMFMVSLAANEYVRIYVGPVLTIGTPVLPGTTREISASIFPGVLGVSFQTPAMKIGDFELRFCQDISFTVFNTTDGSALPIGRAAASNFNLLTGVRVTFPHF